MRLPRLLLELMRSGGESREDRGSWGAGRVARLRDGRWWLELPLMMGFDAGLAVLLQLVTGGRRLHRIRKAKELARSSFLRKRRRKRREGIRWINRRGRAAPHHCA